MPPKPASLPPLTALVHARSRKAVAVGRNYTAHAREMGAAPPSSPFWFFKPSTSYLDARPAVGGVLRTPAGDPGLAHEVELVAVMGHGGAVAGYAVGVDVTARHWQKAAKEGGLPWARSKGGDGFLPLGGFVGREVVERPGRQLSGRMWLRVNGELRQEECVSQMTFALPELVDDIASVVTLEEMDLVLTGTPAGVGPILRGDVVTAGFEGVEEMNLEFRCE
jgi:acylpyruvate hydrolase